MALPEEHGIVWSMEVWCKSNIGQVFRFWFDQCTHHSNGNEDKGQNELCQICAGISSVMVKPLGQKSKELPHLQVTATDPFFISNLNCLLCTVFH